MHRVLRQLAASLQSSYPRAMPNTRRPTRSWKLCSTFDCRQPSCRHRASASVRLRRSSHALNNDAPPSDLLSGRSNRVTTDFPNRSLNTTGCHVDSSRIRSPLARGKNRITTNFYPTGCLRSFHIRELSGLRLERRDSMSGTSSPSVSRAAPEPGASIR